MQCLNDVIYIPLLCGWAQGRFMWLDCFLLVYVILFPIFNLASNYLIQSLQEDYLCKYTEEQWLQFMLSAQGHGDPQKELFFKMFQIWWHQSGQIWCIDFNLIQIFSNML
eukprot:TRINITY_DN9634_c0_g2_i1.p7 TRINITY_DN9634_c0_g2~~TRINITY_DN9634_c0_g2_i1.p7  ORF type:complete len:110 (-),score=1.00 TRINITY_DN9634_c0_g2_i1:1081-1410(-)